MSMRFSLRIFLASVAAAAFFLVAPAARAQAMKVAVVDTQRAIDQTEDGMRATATLKKVFDSRQQELSRKEAELMKQREELDKQSRVLSQAAIQKQVETWQKQMLELQTTYVEYNKELQKKQRELLLPVQEKVMNAIKLLANHDQYDMIVDKAMVAFVRGDLDLTDRIIQMANNGSVAPPTPGAATGAPTAAPGPAPQTQPIPGGPMAPPGPPAGNPHP
jgi:outer membrane protein